MGATSVSIINLVWMSEPLLTALIMVIVGKITFNLYFIPVMIVVLASAFGSDEFFPEQYSTISVSMMVIELICYSFRNIGIKYLTNPEADDDENDEKAKDEHGDNDQVTHHATLEGVAGMSVCGLISLIPVWIYLISNGTVTMTEAWSRLDPLAVVVALCHVNYTCISLALVLAMFDPVQHALLTVAKNINVVLVFYLFIHQTVSTLHVISALTCLVVSIEGTKLITRKVLDEEKEKDLENPIPKKNIEERNQLVFTI